jgi:hypothetical protein
MKEYNHKRIVNLEESNRVKWVGSVIMQLRIFYLRLCFISLESISLKI